MTDEELLEKAAISLQEANACLQLLSYSDSDIDQWMTQTNELFSNIMSRVEGDEEE